MLKRRYIYMFSLVFILISLSFQFLVGSSVWILCRCSRAGECLNSMQGLTGGGTGFFFGGGGGWPCTLQCSWPSSPSILPFFCERLSSPQPQIYQPTRHYHVSAWSVRPKPIIHIYVRSLFRLYLLK